MKVLFFGDSVTEGFFECEGDASVFHSVKDAESGYVHIIEKRLADAFPEEKINVFNAGAEGNTSGDGLLRLKRDVISRKPDIVVVAFGLNDACSRNPRVYAKNLVEIFSSLKKQGITCIYLTPNMMNTYVVPDVIPALKGFAEECAACQNDGSMDNLVQTGIEYAKMWGVTVCDVYAAWKRLAYYGVDTTALLCNHINHPTREMHRLFSDLLYPHLSILISEKLTEADPSVYEESEW